MQEMYEQKAEGLKNVENELLGVGVKFYEAKADSLPMSPPDGMRVGDVKIDLTEIGFQLANSEKQETANFGNISVDMPENSLHLCYRGQRGKKVEVDLVKCNSHIETREFFGKIQPKRVAYTFGEFFTPFVLYRSPHFVEVYKHVNAIWIEGSWLINLRIPITKPSKAKSKRELLPEDKLREQVIIAMLDQFARIS